VKVWDI
jgi:periodic tryptophan protein 1